MADKSNENKDRSTMSAADSKSIANGIAVRFGCKPEFQAHSLDEYRQLKAEKRITYHNSLIELMELDLAKKLQAGTLSYEAAQSLYKVDQLPSQVRSYFEQLANEKGIDISAASFTPKVKAPKLSQDELINAVASAFNVS
tara:strand:- start:972 stop:1391 length:420 start_codon:yes stop_codon:yes gene_type:complete